MAQVVLAGRQELIKIQTGQTESNTAETNDSKTVPISRARRAASRLRQMKGTG